MPSLRIDMLENSTATWMGRIKESVPAVLGRATWSHWAEEGHVPLI